MAATIDYFYAPISGFAYLGEPRLREIAAANSFGPERVADIKKIFARSWIKNAAPGWWIQKADGGWSQKAP